MVGNRRDIEAGKHSQRHKAAANSSMLVRRPGCVDAMNIDRTIADIEYLERVFALPDKRPPTASDLSAANRKHDQSLAHSPWFRLWQSYGICCRGESDPGVSGL